MRVEYGHELSYAQKIIVQKNVFGLFLRYYKYRQYIAINILKIADKKNKKKKKKSSCSGYFISTSIQKINKFNYNMHFFLFFFLFNILPIS
jgi:hypothetical protein